MPRKLLENKFELVDAEIDNNSAYTENALISNVRKLTISGKTYQNFCTYEGEFFNDSGKYKTVEELTNLKSNTTYTVEVDLKSDNVITTNNKRNIFRVDQYDINENSGLGNGVTGTITSTYQTFKFTFKTVSNFKRAILILRNNFSAIGLDSNTMYAKNIKVIEGDHTNTDLPASINEIESVAERESKNLFKDEGWVQKHANGSDSNTRVTNNFRLPVKLNDVYVLNFNAPDNNFQVAIQGYKADGTYYSEGLSTGWLIKSQPPQVVKIKNADVKYIGFTCRYSGDSNISTTDYNVLNSNIIVLPNLYTHGDVNVKGKNSYMSVKKQINVNPNTTYVVRVSIESINKGDNNYTPKLQIKNGNTFICETNSSITFNSGDNTTLEVAMYVNNGYASTTECEANFKNISVTEADLYPVQIAQSHNETDGIVLSDGTTNTVSNGITTKNIKKVVFDGSDDEDWKINSGLNDFYIYTPDAYTTSTRYEILCDGYTFNGATNADKTCFMSSLKNIYFLDYDYADVTSWKAHLKSNPITVYYRLEAPITEPSALTEINIPIPLRSLPNGVKDTIEGNKVIQRIGKIVATSTSIPWAGSLYNVGDDTHMTYVAHGSLNDIKHISGVNNNLICDKLPVGNLTAENSNYNIMVYGHNATNKELRIAVPKTLLPNGTVKEFKEWLDANPVTIYYELATPIEHTINIPPISIAKGTNMVTTNNNIKPELTFKYKRKYKKSSTNNIKYLYNLGDTCDSITGGYLTSSNNSATCNIEKQADNLYVNCTGKTSFDSICYARTNKTIKPCKIKVSVKNNYISANGIAFCVFLSEKEAITSVSDFNSVVNKKYIKASNTTPNEYIDLEMDLTDSTEGYFYIACMVAGNTGYTCTANIRKIEIIR